MIRLQRGKVSAGSWIRRFQPCSAGKAACHRGSRCWCELSHFTARRQKEGKTGLSAHSPWGPPLLKGFPGSHQCPPKDRRFNTQNFIPKGNKETRAECRGQEARFSGPTMKSASIEISRKASWDQPRWADGAWKQALSCQLNRNTTCRLLWF